MNTIEQRVRIPAGPQVIWQYISNLENNARWQVNCDQVSFITTNQQGRGTRWRYNTNNGRAQVAEVTAWYNEVGYEYVIVDGAPFKQNIGRIKLHETAEGTVIHWTFEYELGGVFGGLRNSLTKRAIEEDMAESLWQLWEIISKTDPEQLREFQARSLMRDAPDVEQRANYKSRYSSTAYRPQIPVDEPAEKPVTRPTYQPPAYQPPQPVSFQRQPITEPPIAEDDTRPNPSVQTSEPESAPQPAEASKPAEPDFLSNVTPPAPPSEKPASFTFTEPDVKATNEFTFESDTTRSTQEVNKVKPDKVEDEPAAEAPAPPDEKPTHPATDTQSTPQVEQSEPATKTDEPVPPFGERTTETLPQIPHIEDGDRDIDTSKVSVFDLFGVTKPSDSQQIDAVEVTETEIIPPETTLPDTETTLIEQVTAPDEDKVKDEPADEAPTHNMPTSAVIQPAITADSLDIPHTTPLEPYDLPDMDTGRIGLRVVLRRRRIKLRHPANKK